MNASADTRPLIAHVVFSFSTGGLENGLVNLVNHLPEGDFRHVLISITHSDPQFAGRIRRDDVERYDLHKPPGHTMRVFPELYRLLRELRPAIVHTRNLAALEAQFPAMLAGVPVRIHSEHGWDLGDPDGTKLKNRLIRRAYKPFVHRYVALSRHLESYLAHRVGVSAGRLERICNGVDTTRFTPPDAGRGVMPGSPFNTSGPFVFGTVGRLQAVKDQLLLIRAFAHLAQQLPNKAAGMRLMIVGDGPMREQLEREIIALNLASRVWLAGERSDIDVAMRAMDVFVLPSRAEGISNTILEAMASGLPVVATRVGGNAELVSEGENGILVPSGDAERLAAAMAAYVSDPERLLREGQAARARAEREFSLTGMVARYAELYASQLRAANHLRERAVAGRH